MTEEVPRPDWADSSFWTERPFRFSKFYLNTLFDGRLHLVRRGADFPSHWADEEVSKRLRNAAWWRQTSVRLSPCPQGMWIQSIDNTVRLDGTPELREQLAQALEENARLKDQLLQSWRKDDN